MAWPTTSRPKKNFVTARFDDIEVAALDARASAAGQSRSTYLRECVRRVEASEQRKAARLKGVKP